MTFKIINKGSLLREQRLFPQEAQALSVEVDRSYVDISTKVNDRIIGFYTQNGILITGEKMVINGERYDGFRNFYIFTGTAAINHGITIYNLSQFTNCFGTYTDGTNSYGLIYGTSVAIAGCISFYVTNTQIIFVLGAGAPALTGGRIILNWFNG